MGFRTVSKLSNTNKTRAIQRGLALFQRPSKEGDSVTCCRESIADFQQPNKLPRHLSFSERVHLQLGPVGSRSISRALNQRTASKARAPQHYEEL